MNSFFGWGLVGRDHALFRHIKALPGLTVYGREGLLAVHVPGLDHQQHAGEYLAYSPAGQRSDLVP